MARLDRTHFIENIPTERLPRWHCPYCTTGVLESTKGNILFHESEKSKKESKATEHSMPFPYGHFSGKLTCNNVKCKETVLFAGTGGVDFDDYEEIVEDDGHKSYRETYDWFITPFYFSAAPHIIELHKDYPAAVCRCLEQAFALFWADNASCANKIRIAVELVLENQKIKPKVKGSFVPLQQRIKTFQVKHADAGHYLEAIKWLGNLGSHADDEISRDTLLNGFEFFEQALSIIYDKRPAKLKKLAAETIKRKGRV